MTKDEIKNRISMALKDPVLQQGFEIICKDLAVSEHDREHNDYELSEAYKKELELEKKIDELKQRNAELKGKYAHSAREAGTYEQLIEKMKSALERWHNQYSDKSYTETFYEKLIADTEELLWVNCEK